MSKVCPVCNFVLQDNQIICPQCGARVPNNGGQPQYGNQPPMNWFKFVIYFQIFASVVLNAITGILHITGAVYDIFSGGYSGGYSGMSDYVYFAYPELSILDKGFGISLIVICALGIVARMNLAKFMKNGPKLYFAYIATLTVLSLIYLVAGIAIIGETGDISRSMGNIWGNVILLVLNIIYFNKRKHLFIN